MEKERNDCLTLRKYEMSSFLFVLFASISPCLKSRVKESYPEARKMELGEKTRRNPRRFLPLLSTPVEDAGWDITRMHKRRASGAARRIVTVLIFFRSPRVLWARRYYAHPKAPTLHVYSCAYIFPAVRSSPFSAFHPCGRAERVMSSERRRRNVNIFHEEFGQAFWFWRREHAPRRDLLSKDRRALQSHIRTRSSCISRYSLRITTP